MKSHLCANTGNKVVTIIIIIIIIIIIFIYVNYYNN